MSAAVFLAHEIEWTHAIDRCRLNGRFKRCTGPKAKALRHEAVATEFDPHAATELAELIERRMHPTTTQDAGDDRG